MKTWFTNMAVALRGMLRGWSATWLLVAALGTFALSAYGFDALYFRTFHDTAASRFFGLAGLVGFFAPLFIWAAFLIYGYVRSNDRAKTAAWMSAQAGILGWALSSLLKVFTGRIPPPHMVTDQLAALSRTFQFGIYEGGIFWGWPSSHTATAFAMSVAIAAYYREKKWVGIVAVLYAFYVGLGASMNFHWFSDFFAGVILGSVIGLAVARAFSKQVNTQ